MAAKQNLLKLTQDILGELVSDEVNSINDTPEAMVVAQIIRRVYLDISQEMDLPGERTVIALQPYSDPDFPTYLKIPELVSSVMWLKYDVRLATTANKAYTEICRMEPDQFVTYISGRPSTDTAHYKVVMYSPDVPLIVGTKAAPQYWTSFDDQTLVFDSYNSVVDSTLQASKSMAYVERTADMVLADTSIPPLPENLFPLLYNQALSRCTYALKESANPAAVRDESRFRVHAQRNKWTQGRILTDEPNYGRRK